LTDKIHRTILRLFYSTQPPEGRKDVHLKLKDFRWDFYQREEGDELELQVRRASLRPTPASLELLRHNLAQELAIGAASIRPRGSMSSRRHGPQPILAIPLSDEHLPSRETVLSRVKKVITRLANALKVVSPRHLRPKRPKVKRHEKPLPRLVVPHSSCGGLAA
jgi:hypothetical protein